MINNNNSNTQNIQFTMNQRKYNTTFVKSLKQKTILAQIPRSFYNSSSLKWIKTRNHISMKIFHCQNNTQNTPKHSYPQKNSILSLFIEKKKNKHPEILPELNIYQTDKIYIWKQLLLKKFRFYRLYMCYNYVKSVKNNNFL